MKVSTVVGILIGLILLALVIPFLVGVVDPPNDGDIYTYVSEVSRYWWYQGSQIWEYWSENLQQWVSGN